MKSIIKCLAPAAVLLLIAAGCDYDTHSVVYDSGFAYPDGAVITAIDPPDAAPPGYNSITIIGENFGETAADNHVYFSGNAVETLSASSTSITVRRPNLVSDALTVKVVAGNQYRIAEFSPYKIENVFSDFGNFIEIKILNAIAVDSDENVYVVQKTPTALWKITPGGERSELLIPSKIPTDCRIGPDHYLYLMASHKNIYKVNTVTGEETIWKAGDGKIVTGDFDQSGNFYGGGTKSDLYILSASGAASAFGNYRFHEFRCLRVYNGYVYALIENTRPGPEDAVLGIFRHEILDNNGTLGPQELVLDWTQAGDYAGSNPTYFTIGPDNNFYIATDNENPILMLNMETLAQDILYKDILTPPYDYIVWGPQNIYVVEGAALKVVKIGMGGPGAVYYGRTL